METIHTLSELLTGSDCQYQVYDLGRRVKIIDSKTFSSVEKGLQPYPYAIQRKAQLAIAYWNQRKQPWIWFLKFELDERGLIKQSDIGNFIKLVVEAMGTRVTHDITPEQQEKLSANPYTYKPAEDKLAVFHSQIRAHLSLPCSQYYEHAQHYLSGQLGWGKWQAVGLQGITDICARLGQEQNGVKVLRALGNLPSEPLYALLGALEHTLIPNKIAQKLSTLILNEMASNEPDLFLISALTRALSGADSEIGEPILDSILSSARFSHQEVLIAIAGRCWHWVNNSQRAEAFLLRLAQTNNQILFNQLFADLVMLPELRLIMLPLLHSNPSEELTQAMLNLQKAAKA